MRNVGIVAVGVLVALAAPAAADPIDLTTAGATGTANGAIFVQGQASIVGTGVFDPFVRIQRSGKPGSEAGYNTDARPVEFETKDENQWTHSIQLKDIGEVVIGGTTYREFALDINEPNGRKSEISLDSLKIHLADSGSLTGYPGGGFGPAIYDLDAGGDNWIHLDYDLERGSGNGIDMLAYIPSSLFGVDQEKFVYLYSMFGVEISASDGFEEWRAARGADAGGGVNPIPEPSTIALLGVGVILLLRRRLA